jgi:hypothetical protein
MSSARRGQDRQPTCDHPRFILNEKFTGVSDDDNTITEEYERVYSKRLLTPEEELMAAVLDEAVADYQRYLMAGNKSVKRFAEVERWILEDESDWIFSFVSCCEVLGIRPGYIRRGLLRWKEEKLSANAFPQLKNHNKKPAKRLLRNAA